MAYAIEQVTVDTSCGMSFIFWGEVVLLKEMESGRYFSRYYLKSKQTPTPRAGWKIETYSFPKAEKILLKKGEFINSVTDELGNIYYEVTSLVNA